MGGWYSKGGKERKHMQKSTRERLCIKVANNEVSNNQVWELPSFLGNIERGPKTPEFSRSALHKEVHRKRFIALQNFGGGMGLGSEFGVTP